MPVMIAYWIFDRIHCVWRHVVTSLAVWKAIPRAVGTLVCRGVPLALLFGAPPVALGPVPFVPLAGPLPAAASEAPATCCLPPASALFFPNGDTPNDVVALLPGGLAGRPGPFGPGAVDRGPHPGEAAFGGGLGQPVDLTPALPPPFEAPAAAGIAAPPDASVAASDVPEPGAWWVMLAGTVVMAQARIRLSSLKGRMNKGDYHV